MAGNLKFQLSTKTECIKWTGKEKHLTKLCFCIKLVKSGTKILSEIPKFNFHILILQPQGFPFSFIKDLDLDQTQTKQIENQEESAHVKIQSESESQPEVELNWE